MKSIDFRPSFGAFRSSFAQEERFAMQFLRAACLAGFTPLSRYDLEP